MSVDPAIASGASHQGARDYQEDRYDALAPTRDGPILLIVCDGMGGHANGAEAAQSALDAFVRTMRESADRSVRQRLKQSLDLANDAVGRCARAHPDKRGMGCTLAAALVDEGRVHWVSVGDSPIWLVRGSKVERLNDDHSVGGLYKSLIDKGEMTPEEARQRGGFNQLRSAVMGTTIEIEDLSGDGVELREGDTILVASDGVLTLSETEIADQLRDGDARQAAQALVDQVIAAGRPRQDNVTVVIYRHRRAERPRAEPRAPAPARASRGKRWATALVLLLLLIVLLVAVLAVSAFQPQLLPRR